MGATLQTVADAVGVSRSTVSNAYSRPDQLSAELRAKIFEAAERMGYPGPNPAARSLRSGKIGAIGVLLTNRLSDAFTDPYTVAFLRGLSEAAERHETSLQLIPLPEDSEAARRSVGSASVDAFCVYCVPDWYGALEVVRSRALPLVGGEDPEGTQPGECHVGIDERGSAYQIGRHLADLGHRRVAVIGHWAVSDPANGIVTVDAPEQLQSFVARERIRGFRDAFAEVGVDWKDLLLINVTETDRAALGRAAGYALDRKDRVTAVLATTDVVALGVLAALRDRGLRPGREVSVTGFDDIPEAAATGLTTVAQPSVERGRLSGQMLLDPPKDPAARHHVLPTTLMIRATTGPVPGT